MVTDDFLEEQLERMRRLSEHMSQVHSRVAQNSELISRDRDALYRGPLHEVRDCRTHQTHDYGRADRRERAAGRHSRREPPRPSPRRRRR